MVVDELEILSNRLDPVAQPRPILSSIDTWDQNTQMDYPFSAPARGGRPGWNVPSIAVTNETVNTVRTSAATRFVSQSVATRAPMLVDKVTTSTAYKPMPNMAQTIRTDSNVQISFSAVVRSNTAPHSPYFAVFRDGVKISQDYRSSAGGLNFAFLIAGAYVDTNAPMGFHTYDLRWHVDPLVSSGSPGANIVADGKNRTFQASNLRAL